jgi:anti-sigma factor RsiW
MRCREVVELVTAYLDGALDADARGQLEQHLVACDGCREYLEQMRTASRLAAKLRFEQRPDGAALLAAFRRR